MIWLLRHVVPIEEIAKIAVILAAVQLTGAVDLVSIVLDVVQGFVPDPSLWDLL